MPSLGTGWTLHRQEGNSSSFLGADLHQHPIAFYSCGIGCNGAPAVQLWVMLTRAQKEAAWDNGIRCTRVLFIATHVCCAGNSDPKVMVSMSSRSILCSPHLCVTHAETYIPFPRDNMNDSPLTFPPYSCNSSWDPLRSCCSLKWKGNRFPDVPRNCFICLWLAVRLPSKGLRSASFEEGISSICPPRAEKSRASPLSLPPSTLLALKENRNKIKVAAAALCLWYTSPRGKTWYIHLLSEPLLRDLSEWASYDNRYPSVEINAIFASDISCHTAQIVCADGQVRNTTFQRGENCCNTPLLSSGTAY